MWSKSGHSCRIAATNHLIYAFRVGNKQNYDSDGDYGVGPHLLRHVQHNNVINMIYIICCLVGPHSIHENISGSIIRFAFELPNIYDIARNLMVSTFELFYAFIVLFCLIFYNETREIITRKFTNMGLMFLWGGGFKN